MLDALIKTFNRMSKRHLQIGKQAAWCSVKGLVLTCYRPGTPQPGAGVPRPHRGMPGLPLAASLVSLAASCPALASLWEYTRIKPATAGTSGEKGHLSVWYEVASTFARCSSKLAKPGSARYIGCFKWTSKRHDIDKLLDMGRLKQGSTPRLNMCTAAREARPGSAAGRITAILPDEVASCPFLQLGNPVRQTERAC